MTLLPPLSVRKAHWERDQGLLLHVREIVFIKEQGVPHELELDEHDPDCFHLLALDDKSPVGTGRLRPDGHIGRLAVLPSYRGGGIGRALLDTLVKEASGRHISQVILHAQIQAIPFYERAGFIISSGEFLDAGIPHREMRRAIHHP